jgi:hypothetical protein
MTNKVADQFFNDISFVSIVSTVKGIMTSDGSMSVLLDFERVLDDCDLYAFKNWECGELVQGPKLGRYSVNCTFMWPCKLMPDPRGAKRLHSIGCKVKFYKTKVKVPVKVTNYDDFVQGTMYPKMIERKVWLINIEVPLELMDSIKNGSIDLEDQTIDLREIDDAYDEDLDKEGAGQAASGAGGAGAPGLGGPELGGAGGPPPL